MGRADIAILSEISFGIRLCLHPPALGRGWRVIASQSLRSYPLDTVCRTTSALSLFVARREDLRMQAISLRVSVHERALSRYRVIREDRFYFQDGQHPANHQPS